MVLLQLLSQKDVMSLSDREMEILDTAIDNAILNSPEIQQVLKAKVNETLKTLKSSRPKA